MKHELKESYEALGISNKLLEIAAKAEADLQDAFQRVDEIAEVNQLKVLRAMQAHHVGEAHMTGTTGYGHNDLGRDTLEAVYASVFHTEDALVRPQITCGTHAIATALFGNLRPGDTLFSAAGAPYDTLEEVIGIRASRGSLAEYNVQYRQADLKEDGTFDYDAIDKVLQNKVKMVTIQRSRGYSLRPSFSVSAIKELIAYIKERQPDVICFVDNCYGEFTEVIEPTDVGADLIAGSLIKNPGGGITPCGGYLAGNKELIENAAAYLTSPGMGKDVGASLGILPSFYQGLFLSPTVTANAVKGALFAARVFETLGYAVSPSSNEERHDIIQAITLKTPEKLLAFCEGIQSAAPVDAHVTPVASDMAGYGDQVVMAGGTFVSGSSIELSADGPMRAPYAVFFQGGLTYPHAKVGVLCAAVRVSQGDGYSDSHGLSSIMLLIHLPLSANT
ncbi:MAG: methionine gamma-lyase family protein [Lachnospiraceae bacterium]|nr:methionine gamma-lyase family protein [Lachnospiraceae bacterium]